MKRIFILFILSLSIGYAQTDSIEDTCYMTVAEKPRWSTCAEIIGEDEAFNCFNEQLGKFLSLNIKYPEKARVNNVQGTVYVEFVIEKDGTISNVKVIRNIGFGLDEEATRVINLLPSFIPAKENGKIVRSLFRIPIKFTLTDGKEKDKKKKGKR